LTNEFQKTNYIANENGEISNDRLVADKIAVKSEDIDDDVGAKPDPHSILKLGVLGNYESPHMESNRQGPGADDIYSINVVKALFR
jgi:hypothetical protein